MAKRNSQLTELLVVAQDDYLTIVDTSAGQSKRVSVKNLTGAPDVGWTATGEAWTFSSWNSTTTVGVFTVPSDATLKYSPGMFVRIAQATGGTKYGRILSVTTTTISVWMPGFTLNNEAVNTPVYSPLAHPFGVPVGIADGNPDVFSAYETAGASYTTVANVNFNSENYDPLSLITTGVFTARVAGRYHFDVGLTLQTATSNSVWISLNKNGVPHMRGGRLDSVPGSIYNPTMGIDLSLAAGDTVAFGIAFTAGGSKPLEGIWSYFTGHMIGRI